MSMQSKSAGQVAASSGSSSSTVIDDIVKLWSDLNPTVGYTGGHLTELISVFIQSPANMDAMRARIDGIRQRLSDIGDQDLRTTAGAVLTSLRTQIDLARPSGAGPSGTGMGGVWAAADGIFYIVLKGDYAKPWVLDYLDAVLEAVKFETRRWWGREFTIEVRRECLNTEAYMQGTLTALLQARKDDQAAKKKKAAIEEALTSYKALFHVEDLDSKQFTTYWAVFKKWDAVAGPTLAKGYPECLKSYYQLTDSATEIETTAQAWLELDLPVTAHIADDINTRLFDGGQISLGEIWSLVSKKYAVDFNIEVLTHIVKVCNAFGKEYIIRFTEDDKVLFAPTPDYLVDLVTGGEDFAVDYLDPAKAYSQLYLTASKNTSLLTMINILVHEASHGFNFVLAAKHAASPVLNLNTALQVPLTEGQAFYREYQYWAAAQDLLGRTDPLDSAQTAYLGLYGRTPEEQATGVLCAQLETYIWRVIRYIRALCDVRVNGGRQTYTDFIAWAADFTGLSEETLHGECFTFLAAPGYAPCYAIGGACYALSQKRGLLAGVSEIAFNTSTSRMGFFAWPIDVRKMDEIALGGGGS